MKILSSADIHIHDYARYNVTDPKFRLNQFVKLANRLADIYKEQDCEMIVISGDSIQTAVVPPETQHILKEFYKILSNAVRENNGFVIIQQGNHDRDSRALDTKKEESIITLMEMIPNVEYKHKQIMNVDGLTMGFQDFLPEHPLDWYDGKIDVLFNHFTDMGATWGGQEIDKSRFGVMFFGDIHTPYIKGNIVSIGNPIPHRLKDSCEGSCLIIDTAGGAMGYVPDPDEIIPISDLDKTNTVQINETRSISFKWVDVINKENPFLRIYRPDNTPRKYTEGLEYDIEVPYNVVNERVTVDGELDVNLDNLDIDTILESALNDNTRDVHSQVLSLSKDADISEEAISLNFRMITTNIKNFRSIDEFKFNWNNEVLRMSGKIGSGKSTCANAIMFNFFGNRYVADEFRDTADIKKEALNVDQVLEYNNTYYRIERGYNGKGFVKYWKSKDEDKILLDSYLDAKDPNFFKNEPANKTADIDAMIRRDLPFLDMHHLFYLSQQSNGLFTDMKKTQRIEMISKLLGWNKIVDYSEIANGIIKLKKEEISLIQVDINKLDGAIEMIESMGLVLDERDYQAEIDTLTGVRSTILDALEMQKNYVNALYGCELKQADADAKLSTPKPTMQNGTSPEPEEYNAEIQKIRAVIAAKNLEVLEDTTRYNNDVKLFEDDKIKIASKKVEINNNINSALMFNMKLDQHVAALTDHVAVADLHIKSLYDIYVAKKAEVDQEIEEICITCGQAVHDEVKLAEAKQKRLEAFELAQNNYQFSLNIYNEDLVKLEEAKDALAQKIDVEVLRSVIVKLGDMLEETELKISKVEPIKNFYNTIQTLNESINPYIIYSNALTAWNTVMSKGLKISQEVGEERLNIEEMKHFSDEQIVVFKAKSESILTEIRDMVECKTTADANNASLQLNETRKTERDNKKLSIVDVEKDIDLVLEYIDLTSFTGIIVQKILEKTSEILSTDTMKVQTIDEKKNGNHKPDLTLSVLIGEKWKKYSQLSGGQLFYADIKFILSLFDLIGGCGLAIFDETFKFFDPDMIDEMGAEIKDAKILDTMVITHGSSYIHIDKSIHSELNDRGITIHS